MFERFTDRALRVMALANQEAQRFNHVYIGPEHILLGLVKEGSGVGANLLKNLEIDLRKLRQRVEALMKPEPERITLGKLPQTPRSKKVIEYAIEEARSLNHNYIGTEHLVLGILRATDGIPCRVLTDLGLRLEDMPHELVTLLGVSSSEVVPHDYPRQTFEAKQGQSFKIGNVFGITIESVRDDKVQISIQAPPGWKPELREIIGDE